MKRILLSLAFLLSVFFVQAQGEEELSKIVRQIATELEAKHSGLNKIKVAILEFRTTDNKLTKFNDYLQEELFLAYKNSQRFEIIDQNAINDLIRSFGWDANKARSFEYAESFNKYIFEQIGIVPNAIIYGTITDNDETITITAYIVPNSVKSTNLMSVQKFQSSEYTDKLLGKPVKERKKAEPQVIVVQKEVIVEKPVIVEKEVVVEKPVIVEKQVVVEKPVVLEKEVEKPAEKPNPSYPILKGNVGNYQFEITSVSMAGNKIVITMIVRNLSEDGYIYALDARFFDNEGNEFTSATRQNTFRDRKMIQNIPLKGTITFEGSNMKKIRELSALEINLYESYRKIMGTMLFHNVSVTP